MGESGKKTTSIIDRSVEVRCVVGRKCEKTGISRRLNDLSDLVPRIRMCQLRYATSTAYHFTNRIEDNTMAGQFPLDLFYIKIYKDNSMFTVLISVLHIGNQPVFLQPHEVLQHLQKKKEANDQRSLTIG
ncbi:hypothetical protein DICVIV_00396 [Dictyocaulus viviparus]|uniref:Uncharacterized protein n=1 Tax=Dictyocaulus viviparus TaxID=29172 RepID=A0A0D8Y9D8_DICVI|nr:hypothetical protein DICVIV_00396 [Dictyocaulus viviparus]